jgi:hypothetical protein
MIAPASTQAATRAPVNSFLVNRARSYTTCAAILIKPEWLQAVPFVAQLLGLAICLKRAMEHPFPVPPIFLNL